MAPAWGKRVSPGGCAESVQSEWEVKGYESLGLDRQEARDESGNEERR